MSERGFTNDPYGYLPGSLRNPFIHEGHNLYTPAAPVEVVKTNGRTNKWRAEHKVAAARSDYRAAKKATHGPGEDASFNKSVADSKSALDSAKSMKHEVRSTYNKARKKVEAGGGEKAKAALVESRKAYKSGYRGAFQADKAKRQAAKSKDSGGGLFSKITHAFTHPGETAKRVAKKTGKTFKKAHGM